MVEDHKKNESEVKVIEEVYEMVAEATMIEIKRLEERILALEKLLMSFTYNSEIGSGHPNDGGWFY